MQGETKERWQKLCEQAATEQDPDQLMALIRDMPNARRQREASAAKATGGGLCPSSHLSPSTRPAQLANGASHRDGVAISGNVRSKDRQWSTEAFNTHYSTPAYSALGFFQDGNVGLLCSITPMPEIDGLGGCNCDPWARREMVARSA